MRAKASAAAPDSSAAARVAVEPLQAQQLLARAPRVTSSRRGSRAAPVRWSIDSRTSTRVAGRAAQHAVHVGQQRRAVAGRCRAATSMIVCAELAGLVELGQEGARADLDVHHERVEPGGELLGEDRGDDQRDRLDRAGGVADGVEPPVGGGEVAGLADDRAARLAHGGARSARGRAPCRSRGSRRACRACRRCGRGRGRRSSAPRRRTRRRSARAAARPCRRRRRSSACRAPGRSRSHCRTSPERVMAPVSATRSSPPMPVDDDRHRQRPDLRVADRAVGDAGDEPLDLLGAQRRAVALAADDLLGQEGSCQPPDEALEQRGRGRRRRVRRRSASARGCSGTSDMPFGEVGDGRDGSHAQPGVAGEDRLVDRRHADRVGAQGAEGADLGRRLEARPADGEVDALGEVDAELARRSRAGRRAAPGRRRRTGWGSAGRWRRRWARSAGCGR